MENLVEKEEKENWRFLYSNDIFMIIGLKIVFKPDKKSFPILITIS